MPHLHSRIRVGDAAPLGFCENRIQSNKINIEQNHVATNGSLARSIAIYEKTPADLTGVWAGYGRRQAGSAGVLGTSMTMLPPSIAALPAAGAPLSCAKIAAVAFVTDSRTGSTVNLE